MSHLLQMRGLKQKQMQLQQAMYGSHLLQMRGLKLCPQLVADLKVKVASFTDAWIETKSPLVIMTEDMESHLLQMRGLKLTFVVYNNKCP